MLTYPDKMQYSTTAIHTSLPKCLFTWT